MEQHILRLPTVKAITGLSRSTIYLRMSEGSFPRQVNLGSRAVGWLASEIDHWIEEKLASRNQAMEVK
jgi:prophage regulatory protein|tara:strand:- start:316 stop:519 length:204 start_codon:yes stop_codon:yes gene_type:complete